ncbi:MAG: hypothetical protein Q8N47_11670 [Bryobacterales bacterium]|nr:hypothetical protein [Bryobacterales bacterium]
MKELFALLCLAATAPICAQTPIVSSLHTVSVHIDSPETYNALYRLFEKDLQWPVIYGKPWPPDRQGRRSYAGIWAGNVVLEICGPYAGETFSDGVRARLHGLTFRPHQTTDQSTADLDRAGISHKPPFGNLEGGARFVVLDDPALTSPTLAVSIMQGGDRNREKTEHDAARAALAANRGGPLGLKSVKETQVAYPNAPSLAKWRQFLAPSQPDTGPSPRLRFVEGPQGALAALVLQVESAPRATSFFRQIGSDKILTPGVTLHFTE